MRKFLKAAIAFTLSLGFVFGTAACSNTSGQYALPYYDQSADDVYNDDLYYRNDMEAACADPTVIYIDDESDPDYGWFFMYPTSDSDFGCHGYSAYRSKDMETWEYVGPIFEPETASWSHDNMWAPEVVRDETTGKYYLFYSAKDGTRTDGKYFDNHAEKKEYHEIENVVNGYDYAAATTAMETEKTKFSTDTAFEGYTDYQKTTVRNELSNYELRKSQEIWFFRFP